MGEHAAAARVEIALDAPANEQRQVSETSVSTPDNASPEGVIVPPPYVVDGRDLRVDLIRGLIMMSVISVHAFMLSAVSFLFWERVGIVSSGEGFVLLSGVVLGIVHMRTLARHGFGRVCDKVLTRAAQLYRTYLGVSLAIVLIRLVPGVKVDELTSFTNKMTGQVYPLFPSREASWVETLSRICRLQAGPHQYQVIGLYVVLMAFAPVVLWLLHRGYTRHVLGASWAIYFANVVSPTLLSWGAFEYAFPSYVWQLLFVHGLALGAHWSEVNAWLLGTRGRNARYLALALALGLALFSWNHPQPNLAAWTQLHWIAPAKFYSLYGAYFSKTLLGPGRLLNVACLFVCLLWAVTRLWKPLARFAGPFLIPIGQATLYVFIVHVFLILVLNQFEWARSPGFFLATAIHVGMIAVIYVMVKRKVLYAIIPR